MKLNKQEEQCISYFKYLILDKLEDINCWIAGGAIRDYFSIGKIKSDIDIFFTDEIEYYKAVAICSEFQVINQNENAIMLKNNGKLFHLIKKHFYNSPEDTINSFDFTVCCCACTKDKIVVNDSFYMDLARRRLVINSLPYPLSTLQRLQKYIKKGFWICNMGLLELSKGIMKVDLTNKESNSLEYYPDGLPKFMRID